MPVALLSVSDKNEIDIFARGLCDLGWEILASGGTAKYLSERNIKVRDVAFLVGGGPILSHRVVTLSREIHAGILAADTPEDAAELMDLGLPRIDLVCVDLYPLQKTIEQKSVSRDAVISGTDVGGIALLHAGAKGRRIVIAHPRDRSLVLAWLKDGRPYEDEFITELMVRAEAVVADYALAGARYHSGGRYDGHITSLVRECVYGENAHQKPAALLSTAQNDPLSLDTFVHEGGMPPSYNNLADMDRLLQTMAHIGAVFDVNRMILDDIYGTKRLDIAIAGKHGNVCGASVGTDTALVLKNMVEGDARAIFGGVVMLNFPVTVAFAEVLLSESMLPGSRRLLDMIIAPSFEPLARELLSARKGSKCRLFSNGALLSLDKNSLDVQIRYRYVRGGFLRQPNYLYVPDFNNSSIERFGDVAPTQMRDIFLAWAIGSTSNSNTVSIVRDSMLIGNGVGQQDRVTACALALRRAHDAGHSTIHATAYSDSFFPFVDGPELLANAGIGAIFSSSGSVRDEEVKTFCKKRGIALCMIPDALGRGFFGH